MNKQYIKRQINLNKLGFPIDKDIQEYYNYFHQLIGNINNFKKLTYNDYPNSIFWKKDKKIYIKYNKVEKQFVVNYSIWVEFEKNYELNYIDIGIILTALLEIYFGRKAKTTKVDALTLL